MVDGEVVLLRQLQQLFLHALLRMRGSCDERIASPVEVQQQGQDGGGHLGSRGARACERGEVVLVACFVVSAFL